MIGSGKGVALTILPVWAFVASRIFGVVFGDLLLPKPASKLAFIAIAAAGLIAGCQSPSTPSSYPTYTPYPTQTPLPTNTPYPTYTPYPTQAVLPTYTPYPSPTPSATTVVERLTQPQGAGLDSTVGTYRYKSEPNLNRESVEQIIGYVGTEDGDPRPILITDILDPYSSASSCRIKQQLPPELHKQFNLDPGDVWVGTYLTTTTDIPWTWERRLPCSGGRSDIYILISWAPGVLETVKFENVPSGQGVTVRLPGVIMPTQLTSNNKWVFYPEE